MKLRTPDPKGRATVLNGDAEQSKRRAEEAGK